MTEAIHPETVNVVEPVSVDDNAGSLTVDGVVTANLAAGANNIGDVDVLTVPAPLSTAGGGTEATALRVTVASDSTGVLSVDDNGGSLTVDGTVTANLAAGVNNIGDVDVLTVPADPFGANADAASASGSISAKLRFIATTGIPITGTTAVSGTVTAANAAGDVAHDGVDSGNPVKVGSKAVSALPTAVAANDRANNISDLWGRQLTAHIDTAMQVWKAVNVTTTQTGSDVWTPASGKKIAVTFLSVASYGTTAARVILWFGDNADTTYTAGTDQVLWAGSFAPSTTVKPGMVVSFPIPVVCVTADRELHLTTDAAISLDITVYGYEF